MEQKKQNPSSSFQRKSERKVVKKWNEKMTSPKQTRNGNDLSYVWRVQGNFQIDWEVLEP